MRVVETMTKVNLRYYTVRVWRDTKCQQDPAKGDKVELGHHLPVFNALSECEGLEEITKALEALPDVAAYEIVNLQGCGFVVYPDWH